MSSGQSVWYAWLVIHQSHGIGHSCNTVSAAARVLGGSARQQHTATAVMHTPDYDAIFACGTHAYYMASCLAAVSGSGTVIAEGCTRHHITRHCD